MGEGEKKKRPQWTKEDDLSIEPGVVRRVDLPGGGVIRRGRRHQPTGLEIERQAITRPTDKKVAIVHNEATGETEVVDGSGIDQLGHEDPSVHYSTTFLREARARLTEGGGEILQKAREMLSEVPERTKWWVEVGKNILPRTGRESNSS